MSTRKVKDAKDLESNEKIYFKSHAKATYMSDGKTVEEIINNIKSDYVNNKTLDQIINQKADIAEIPTKVSQLENDADYLPNTTQLANGVYVVDLNGNLCDADTYDGTDVTGIGLVTDKGAWVVALDEWYSTSSSTAWNGNKSAWGGYGTEVTGCFTTTTSSSTAITDFNGEANTDAIIAQLSGTSDGQSGYTGAPAAEYCRAYSKGYKGVGEWYLPAAGELNEIVLNKDAINAVLTKLGKNSLSKNSYSWSSSQCGSDFAWYYHWGSSAWSTYRKNNSLGVHPIAKLIVPPSITSRIESLENNKADKSEIPTKVSQLENDVPYALKSEVEVKVEDGVYAVTADGDLIDYNTADSSCIGVALVANEHKFMIAKKNAKNNVSSDTLYWEKSFIDLSLTNYKYVDGTNTTGYLPKPDGTFVGSTHLSNDFTTWTAGALSDFNGKANTAVIAEASSHAQDMCTVLNTFNASDNFKDWYVPACGQLALMYLNKTEINTALTKIGGNVLTNAWYWSSSEYDSDCAWAVYFL